ncbi:MAG TPA: hypothetical protein VFM54_15470 [Micromonosporaceae bacterium]|nr:hypothetical protein [Micromonosporaceae bacterium]
MYEIADGYLAFWFAVRRDDADLIEGGQGVAVRQRTKGDHAGRGLPVAGQARRRT